MVVQEKPTHRDGGRGQGSNDRKHRLKQRFEVLKKLGQGTYGKVQLAVNKETKQEVAIKTIKKAKIENEQDLVRIRREIQIMSSIQHPHIIHIYEVFENHEKIVLIMQYASGGELYDYLGCHRNLPEIEARRIFRQIAAAIYYCHKNKICHRDLKLENILLDDKGNAKIADFGLSNVFDDRHKLRTFCGSPLYASPEIVKGSPYYGPEVDCWSLGVLLYTLVYGSMPFDGSNFKRLVRQISEGDYYEPKKKSEASGLIRRLLTVDVSRRANIRDICADWWVNRNYDHSLLRVADDMANLTPVRLDLLLALSSVSPLPPETGTKIQTNSSSRKEKESCVATRPSQIAKGDDDLASEGILSPGQTKRRERQAELSTKVFEDSPHPHSLIDYRKGGREWLGADDRLFSNGHSKATAELDSAGQSEASTSPVADAERKACDILGEVHFLIDDVIASVEQKLADSRIVPKSERATTERARECSVVESVDQTFQVSKSSESHESFLAERVGVRREGFELQRMADQSQLEGHDDANREQSFLETTATPVERKSSEESRSQHVAKDLARFSPSRERTHPARADGSRSAAEETADEVNRTIGERNMMKLLAGGSDANRESDAASDPRENVDRRPSLGVGSKERRTPRTEPASVLPIFDVFSNIPKRHVTNQELDAAAQEKAHRAHVIQNLRREARTASRQQQDSTSVGAQETKPGQRSAPSADNASDSSRRKHLDGGVALEEMDPVDSVARGSVEIPKRSPPASCSEFEEKFVAATKSETEKQRNEQNEPPKIPPKNRSSFKIPKPLIATKQKEQRNELKSKEESERGSLKHAKTVGCSVSEGPLQKIEINESTNATKDTAKLPRRNDAAEVSIATGEREEPTLVKNSEEMCENKAQERGKEKAEETPKAAQRKSRRDVERRIASTRSKKMETEKAETQKGESENLISEVDAKMSLQSQEKKVTFHEKKGEIPDAAESRSEDSRQIKNEETNSSTPDVNIPDSVLRHDSENHQHNREAVDLQKEGKCFGVSNTEEIKERSGDEKDRTADVCTNQEHPSEEKAAEITAASSDEKGKHPEHPSEVGESRSVAEEAFSNLREFTSEIPKKPKRRSLSRTRGMSMEFERLAEQPRQRLGPPKKPPGKIQIPKYFDPSQGVTSPRTPEKKEIIFVPTRSVSENKEKIERKIEKVKKAAIVIPPRRRSDAGMNPRRKKYTRSQTDFLPRNIDVSMHGDDEDEVENDLEPADDETGRSSSLGQPGDSECVEMTDVSHLVSERWQPIDHDEEMRDAGISKTALDGIQQKSHRHSMDSESGYWTPTEMAAGAVSGFPQEMKGGSETAPHSGMANDFRKMTPRERSAITLKNAKLRLKLSDEGLDNCSLSSSLESGINSWKHDEGSTKRLSPEGESEDKSTSALSLQDESLQSGPVPITRSYKKITFSPGDELSGECDDNDIRMENENWDLEADETKSNVEGVEMENGKTSSLLKASESHSSSGSNDISDDVFENWVGEEDSVPPSSGRSKNYPVSSGVGCQRGQSKERERRERKWHSSEWWSSYSTDKDSSDNDDDLDIMIDESRPTIYGSEGLWQFLKSVNKDLNSHLRALKKTSSKPAWLRSKSQECRDPEELGSTQKMLTRSLSREDKQTPSDAPLRHYTSEGRLFANSDFDLKDLTSEESFSSKDYSFKAGSMDGIYKWEKEFMGFMDDDISYQSECSEKASLYGTLRPGNFEPRRYGQHLEERRHSLRGREGEHGEGWARWKSMQGIDNTEGIYMSDPYSENSQLKSPVARRMSLYGTLRQNNLTQKDRATSQIVLNTDDGYQILYNDSRRRSKVDAEGRAEQSDYSGRTMSRALSEMDVSPGGALHKRSDTTISGPYQQETMKSLPRFSKSLGSRLNLESCITQTPVREKTSEALKETNVKRRVSFSSNLDPPRAHNSSLHYLQSMSKLRGAKEELFGTNSSASVLKDEPTDAGSLLEALKTQGYRSIMSQRLQPGAVDTGRLNQRFLTGICPPSSPKSAFDNLDYILRDSQTLLQQSPTYPGPSDYGRVGCYATLSPSLSRKNWTTDPVGLFYQRPTVGEVPNSYSTKLTDDFLPEKRKYRDVYGSKATTDSLQQFPDTYRGELSSTWKTTIPDDGYNDTPRVRSISSKLYQLRQTKSVEQPQEDILDEESESEAPVTRNVEDSIGQLSEKIKALKSRCQRKSLDESRLRMELAELDGSSISDPDKESKRERQVEAINYEDLSLDSSLPKTNGKEESVSDRIWRKSFYSRFNDVGAGRRRKSSFFDSEVLQECKLSGSTNKYDIDLEGGGEASWVMASKGKNDASYASATLPRQLAGENLLSSYSQRESPCSLSYTKSLSRKNVVNEEFSSSKTDRRTTYADRLENGDDFRCFAKGYLPTLYFEGHPASSDPESRQKLNERFRLPEHAYSDNDVTTKEKRKASCPPCASQRSPDKNGSKLEKKATNLSVAVNCDKTECSNLLSQMNGLDAQTSAESEKHLDPKSATAVKNENN